MIRLIRELVRPYRWSLSLVLGAMMVEILMSMAAPWPLKVIIDNVAGGQHLPGGVSRLLRFVPVASDRLHLGVLAAAATMLIAASGAGAAYIDSYFSESVAQRVAHDLRMRTYHHLQRLSLSYYDKHQVSASLSTLSTDIQTIQDFASAGTLNILIDLLAVVGMLALMLSLNRDFALVAVAVAPFLLWFVSRFRRSLKKATRLVRQNDAEMIAVEMYGLQSQRLVEAFGTQALEEARLSKVSQEAVQSALRARRIKSSLSPIVSLTVAMCTALMLWRGSVLVLAGTMTLGVLTVFLTYLARFFKPVQDLAKMTNVIAQATVAVGRIQSILQTDETIRENPNAVAPKSVRGDIAFERVGFHYDVTTPVLRDVSFRINAGQFVGIVGPTGSGKSTVISLIPRFYDPTAGKITVDGIDIRDYQVQALRYHFAFVLQDTVLFRGTIGENIAYGRSGAPDEEIVEAARFANAHEFIQRLPSGYQTVVGERGMTLSGGQRQRLGIARAIIRNSPVLILDEPTAALDAEAEEQVIEALERLMKGRTVVMVTHRLSTLGEADKVIVLKDGFVSEEGTHGDLLSMNGVYAGLHRAQQQHSWVYPNLS